MFKYFSEENRESSDFVDEDEDVRAKDGRGLRLGPEVADASKDAGLKDRLAMFRFLVRVEII